MGPWQGVTVRHGPGNETQRCRVVEDGSSAQCETVSGSRLGEPTGDLSLRSRNASSTGWIAGIQSRFSELVNG